MPQHNGLNELDVIEAKALCFDRIMTLTGAECGTLKDSLTLYDKIMNELFATKQKIDAKQMPTSFYKRLEAPQSLAVLAVLNLVDYYDQGFIITRINTPLAHRGNGIASGLLKECCSEADRCGVKLWLEVVESDGLSNDDLVAWYKRHGFKGDWSMMVRKPR